MPEILVVFQKPRTQIKISYWELRPRYWEFGNKITTEYADLVVNYCGYFTFVESLLVFPQDENQSKKFKDVE